MFTKKQIWSLVIPLMVEQVLTSLMGTADTMMISCAGSAAISAVSLVDSINVLIIYIFSAMATGGAVICAQYLGRSQKEEANETGKQLILTVLGLSLFVTLFIVALRGPLLRLIFGRVEADVMENALVYLLITALSYPFIALYNAAAALFRVDGKSRLTMVVSTVANIVNVVLNALFIFVLDMSTAGAALATLASRIVCAVAVLYYLRQPRQSIVVRDYRRFRPDMKRIWHIVSVGVPNGIENGMFQFGKLAIQSTISTLGTVAIAAQAMTSVLEGFTSRPPEGIGLGMMTIVGQCIGADRPDEARKYIRQLTLYAHIATAVVCVLVALLVRPITILADMEPEAADLTVRLTYVVCLVKALIWTYSFIPAYGLRAAGDLRFCMMVSASTMWLCRVVIVTVLIRGFGFGPMGVWIGMFCDWAVRGTLYTLRFRSGRWATKKVIRT
ncbi:MAG: MATE family efflux transporter [Clostridia bacterium]|nr:MATE family efflux transporter [Clostridia bacterium]